MRDTVEICTIISQGMLQQDFAYSSSLSIKSRGPIPYPNLDFIRAFSQSFLAVVRSLDPNAKYDSANITPRWPSWRVVELGSHTEMRFDKIGDVPLVENVLSDKGVLSRCR